MKLQKLKCFFGIHDWKKFMGSRNVGGGKFSQKYACETCRKIREEII
ncbi:MAG TPA: hypothetical protein VJ208_03025 [Candidatus Nanoarchaeia archaeon]|nr:hypothetical protein [Candidatus Nanoarchaeia archaeon]